MMNFSKKKNYVNFEFFLNHPPTFHIKYKVTDFAPSNVEIMTNDMFNQIGTISTRV